MIACHEPAHAGASLSDARLKNWIPTPSSADAALSPDEREILTSRARDLARNSGIASGYLNTIKANVVGHQLRLSSRPDYRLLGKDADWARTFAANVEGQYRSWADTTACDAANTLTLHGLTLQMLSGALMNGDGLAIPIWSDRPGTPWKTRIQVIESDRLSTPYWLVNRNDVRDGVHIDDYGAPIGCWVEKRHPGDRYGVFGLNNGAREWEYIPAFTAWGRRRVVHLYDKERPGQNRGKSAFASVLREFRVSAEYLGHELHAAAANAVIAAFVESDLPPEAVHEMFTSDPKGEYWKEVGDKYARRKLEGGLISVLPVGTKLSSFNTSRPNVAFDPFMTAVARHLSVGLNIPYELLLKDFSRTNYSSARAALLEAWRQFQLMRRWLADQWLSVVFSLWLEEAINSGAVEADLDHYYNNRYAYERCRWIFAGRGWVDPVKEVQAMVMRLEAGVSTLEAECAEQGLEWEEVLEQLAIENAYRKELGLPPVNLGAMLSVTAPTDTPQGDKKASEPSQTASP